MLLLAYLINIEGNKHDLQTPIAKCGLCMYHRPLHVIEVCKGAHCTQPKYDDYGYAMNKLYSLVNVTM